MRLAKSPTRNDRPRDQRARNDAGDRASGENAANTSLPPHSPAPTKRPHPIELTRFHFGSPAKIVFLTTGLAILVELGWLWSAAPPTGAVEAARVGRDKVELSGWAVDAKAAKQASAIYVTVDGRVVAQAKPSEVRIDRPGPKNVPTGFHVVLDKALIEGKRHIGVYAATEDGIRELSYSWGLALPFGAEHRPDRLTLLIGRTELGEMAVNSEYRRQTGSARNTGRSGVIAGASAEGIIDGYRQAARFGDPSAMAASPDGETLFVLDDAAKAIRRVDVVTGLVETIAQYPAGSNFTLIAAADRARFFVYDTATQRVVEYAGASRRELPLPEAAAGPLGWIAWANGRLFAIGSAHPVLMSSDGEAWETAIEFPAETGFDRFAVTGPESVVVHSTGKSLWAPYSLTGKTPLAPALLGPVAKGIAPVGSTGRAIAYDGAALFDVPPSAKWAPPAALRLFNVEGKPIGPTAALPAYRSPVVDSVTSLAVSAKEQDFIILDRANHRIVRLGGNYSMAYDENPLAAVNSHRVIGPEYQATKPWGVNRIVWLSHSVYWDPAGDHAGNLAYSAPVRLERMLNADGPVRWEVLTANVSGGSFYSDAYGNLSHILTSYGVDYALVVVDLLNFLWFLQFAGLAIPVVHDASGAPVGIDAMEAAQAMSSRSYPPAIAALRDHIVAAHGPQSAVPLMAPPETPVNDLFATRNFMRAWSEDATLRNLMGDIFVTFIQHLNGICRQKGVRLIVAMAPSNNFVAVNDWSDPYRMGGAERRYDVEIMHRPFVAQLKAAGIDAIDFSYALMARQPAAYPFDVTSTAHHTHLFHQAVAEALREELLGRGLISLSPQPRRTAETAKLDSVDARNKIFNYRDGQLVVLHDLWNGTDDEPPLRDVTDADFPRLLELAMKDARSYIDARSISPRNAKIDFVHVTAKDDYANMDIRSLRPVATMLLRIADMEQIKQMAAAGKWDEVKRLVEYRTGSRSR
jgi:hypothetical protein